MDKLSALDKRISECVGLWLAEGDNKSMMEITFTNSCFELVDLFYKTINKIFKNYKYNPRIYIYSKNNEKIKIPYKNFRFKHYKDKRATRPYFILRFASVKMVKEWKKIVMKKLKNKNFYQFILRGFFAGEGNIHEGKRSVRVIRISQKERKEFIDKILDSLGLSYNFTSSNRMYNLSNKKNWDIFSKYKLADLHPFKKEKFWKVYSSFKEEHYPKNYLIKTVYFILNKPKTTRELSEKVKRSFARIQDVLILLKKQGKAFNYRIGSFDYWTNNKDLILISKLKKAYLLYLDTPKLTADFSKKFKVDWKSSFNRLKELERLDLIKMDKNRKWTKTQTQKNILVI